MAKISYAGTVPDRALSIVADGVAVKEVRHVRLKADYLQSMFPAPYNLLIWNPTKSVEYQLKQTKHLEVSHDMTLLASGDVTEVFREVVPEGVLLTVVFCLGKDIWERYVSATLGKGLSAFSTVNALLSIGGSRMRLLSSPRRNPGFVRNQSFCGRMANYVISLLSACGSAPYLVPAGIALRNGDEMPKEVVIDMDSISGPWVNEEIEV